MRSRSWMWDELLLPHSTIVVRSNRRLDLVQTNITQQYWFSSRWLSFILILLKDCADLPRFDILDSNVILSIHRSFRRVKMSRRRLRRTRGSRHLSFKLLLQYSIYFLSYSMRSAAWSIQLQSRASSLCSLRTGGITLRNLLLLLPWREMSSTWELLVLVGYFIR